MKENKWRKKGNMCATDSSDLLALKSHWDAHADALNIINPLSPKRDQHQISPCNINTL